MRTADLVNFVIIVSSFGLFNLIKVSPCIWDVHLASMTFLSFSCKQHNTAVICEFASDKEKRCVYENVCYVSETVSCQLRRAQTKDVNTNSDNELCSCSPRLTRGRFVRIRQWFSNASLHLHGNQTGTKCVIYESVHEVLTIGNYETMPRPHYTLKW